jgi:hypothetical protein
MELLILVAAAVEVEILGAQVETAEMAAREL